MVSAEASDLSAKVVFQLLLLVLDQSMGSRGVKYNLNVELGFSFCVQTTLSQ